MFRDRALPAIKPKQTPDTPEPARVMDLVVARYVHACARVMETNTGFAVRSWLHGRGISDETIRANLIGADPGREMMRRNRGLPYGVGRAATFPVFDPAGNLTYVQTRYLDVEAAGRKYDNPSAALAPHPRLGFTVTSTHLRSSTLLVCEGMPDALVAAQAGFRSIGLLGAHTPDESVAARVANHAANLGVGVVLMCDPDQAGRRLADTFVPMLVGQDCTPAIVIPPDGCDLSDWAQRTPDWADQLCQQVATDTAVLQDGVVDQISTAIKVDRTVETVAEIGF